jgi:ABC-type glutathione transport system ATPase component
MSKVTIAIIGSTAICKTTLAEIILRQLRHKCISVVIDDPDFGSLTTKTNGELTKRLKFSNIEIVTKQTNRIVK